MILSIIAAALLSIPLTADEAPAPLLFIERIEVRNAKRVSTDVVIAESRLREGHEYSEADLRDASTRLGRLPFLLSVDFALEKGSDRGRHVLVLTINETKPFFFLIDAQPHFEGGNEFLEIDDRGRSSGGETLALGFRWFIGRRGAVHVGFAGTGTDREFAREYASFVVGYTQYDIFGTRAFATLNLKKPIEGYGEGDLSPQLVVGIPVAANQTVTLQYDETRFAPEERVIGNEVFIKQFAQRVISAKWSYNTTNEPFFPTSGTLIYVMPMIGWTDSGGSLTITSDNIFSSAGHADSYGAEAGATQYWELTDRDSVWGDVRGEWARIDSRTDFPPDLPGIISSAHTATYGSVGIGYTRSLWTQEERANGGDSRVEVTGRFSNRTRRYPNFPIDLTPGRDVRQFGAAWLRRTSWGTLRLGAGYAW
jgi:hypothetical protein